MRTMRAMVASSPSVALLLAATSCRMAVTFTTAAYLPVCVYRTSSRRPHVQNIEITYLRYHIMVSVVRALELQQRLVILYCILPKQCSALLIP
jgi:hypothetical protein